MERLLYTRRNILEKLMNGFQWIILPDLLFRWAVPSRPINIASNNSLHSKINFLKPPSKSIGEAFEEEVLLYEISFLWFRRAARGRIAFMRRGDKDYKASVVAETLGIIGWITRYRKDVYNVYMEEIDGGRRLRTYLFEKTITIGKRVRKGYIRLDYNNRVMDWKSYGGDRPEKGATEPIPPMLIYDDPIVIFYNFRYGAYGPLQKGKEYYINTFPKDGKPSFIYLRIATDEEKKRRLWLNRDGDDIEYLVDLNIEGEMIDSKTGEIEIHLNHDMLPVRGIVKDIIFFGDVHGTLSKRIGI